MNKTEILSMSPRTFFESSIAVASYDKFGLVPTPLFDGDGEAPHASVEINTEVFNNLFKACGFSMTFEGAKTSLKRDFANSEYQKAYLLGENAFEIAYSLLGFLIENRNDFPSDIFSYIGSENGIKKTQVSVNLDEIRTVLSEDESNLGMDASVIKGLLLNIFDKNDANSDRAFEAYSDIAQIVEMHAGKLSPFSTRSSEIGRIYTEAIFSLLQLRDWSKKVDEITSNVKIDPVTADEESTVLFAAYEMSEVAPVVHTNLPAVVGSRFNDVMDGKMEEPAKIVDKLRADLDENFPGKTPKLERATVPGFVVVYGVNEEHTINLNEEGVKKLVELGVTPEQAIRNTLYSIERRSRRTRKSEESIDNLVNYLLQKINESNIGQIQAGVIDCIDHNLHSLFGSKRKNSFYDNYRLEVLGFFNSLLHTSFTNDRNIKAMFRGSGRSEESSFKKREKGRERRNKVIAKKYL